MSAFTNYTGRRANISDSPRRTRKVVDPVKSAKPAKPSKAARQDCGERIRGLVSAARVGMRGLTR